MNSSLRLPPVDVYRQPLVEPLGHLVLQAAYLDNALYAFIALMRPLGPETTAEQVAHRLRNWNGAFVSDAVGRAILDPLLRSDVLTYFSRVAEGRERRHRMVHDAMELGLDDAPGGGYEAIILKEGYERTSKQHTVRRLSRVTAEDIAALAFELYDLRLEVDTILGRWGDLGGPEPNGIFD
jgi:hypothetical protein